MTDKLRIADGTTDALIAFWASVSESFPEIKTGDIKPVADLRFLSAAEYIIEHWVKLNAPPVEPEHKGRHFALVEVFQEGLPTCETCVKYKTGPQGYGRCSDAYIDGVCYPSDGCSFHETETFHIQASVALVEPPLEVWRVRYMETDATDPPVQSFRVSAKDGVHAIDLFANENLTNRYQVIDAIKEDDRLQSIDNDLPRWLVQCSDGQVGVKTFAIHAKDAEDAGNLFRAKHGDRYKIEGVVRAQSQHGPIDNDDIGSGT